VYYAHRVGTAWEQRVVADSRLSTNPLTFEDQVAIAVDDCGAPHIAVGGNETDVSYVYYFRWASAAWRWARFHRVTAGFTALFVAITLTDDFALVGSHEQRGFRLTMIPRN